MSDEFEKIERALRGLGHWVSSIRQTAKPGQLVIQIARPLKVILHNGETDSLSIMDQDRGKKVRIRNADAMFVACLYESGDSVLPQRTVRSIYSEVASAEVGVDMLRRRLRDNQIEPSRLFSRVRGRGYVLNKDVKVRDNTQGGGRRLMTLFANTGRLRKPAEVSEDTTDEWPREEEELIPVLRTLGREDAAMLLCVLRWQRQKKDAETIARYAGINDSAYQSFTKRAALALRKHGVPRELPTLSTSKGEV